MALADTSLFRKTRVVFPALSAPSQALALAMAQNPVGRWFFWERSHTANLRVLEHEICSVLLLVET
jgi:hypothetical protein